jgi:hypothetical protein
VPIILLGTFCGAATAGVLSSGLSWIGMILAVQLGACIGALIGALVLRSR